MPGIFCCPIPAKTKVNDAALRWQSTADLSISLFRVYNVLSDVLSHPGRASRVEPAGAEVHQGLDREAKNRTSTSYTLEWVEFGQRRFFSLGPHATLAFAREAARRKEQELNNPERLDALEPVTWDVFKKKYLDTIYPGHDLPTALRKEKEKSWPKSRGTFKRERNALDSFSRLIKPGFCHEITAEGRERFVQKRLPEVGSSLTVDTELRALRLFCNVMEEWKHRPENSNPFAGRGRATAGARRKRAKEREAADVRKEKHYTFDEVKAILARAAQEAAEDPTFAKKRLRALVSFIAYTGCRFGEAVHLEWKDVDWDRGVACL